MAPPAVRLRTWGSGRKPAFRVTDPKAGGSVKSWADAGAVRAVAAANEAMARLVSLNVVSPWQVLMNLCVLIEVKYYDQNRAGRQ